MKEITEAHISLEKSIKIWEKIYLTGWEKSTALRSLDMVPCAYSCPLCQYVKDKTRGLNTHEKGITLDNCTKLCPVESTVGWGGSKNSPSIKTIPCGREGSPYRGWFRECKPDTTIRKKVAFDMLVILKKALSFEEK